jgi:P27 family predicted phage terminase small subunit
MPGPAPKPTELKRKLGNPGKEKLPDLNRVIALPQVSDQAPQHLSKQAKKFWTAIRAVAPWIANTDGTLLLELCEKMDRKTKLVKELEQSAFVLYTDKGYAYANPLVGMISTTENEILKILSLLGLTPSDRSKLGVAEVKVRSKIEELISQKRNA